VVVDPPVEVDVVESPLPLVSPLSVLPCPSARSLAAADTHWLKGVPCCPAVCRRLRPLQALVGFFAEPEASLAMAVTHWLNGVPL
jgi:hypothetical protein